MIENSSPQNNAVVEAAGSADMPIAGKKLFKWMRGCMFVYGASHDRLIVLAAIRRWHTMRKASKKVDQSD